MNRPTRLGIAYQQLRASAALLLTPLSLCLEPVATEPLAANATEAASVIEARRRKRERGRLPPSPDLPPF